MSIRMARTAHSLVAFLLLIDLSCRTVEHGPTTSTTGATKLALVTSLPMGVDGHVFPVQPVVEIQDANGMREAGAVSTVSVVLLDGSGHLFGATSVGAVGGRATFSDLGYNGVGLIRLRFTSGDLTGVTSDTMAIAARTAVVDSTVLTLVPDTVAQAAGTYTFAVTGPTPAIDSGEDIIGIQGGGFLRRVLAVQQSGTTLTVQTADASLQDLGASGTYADSVGLGLPRAADRDSPRAPTHMKSQLGSVANGNISVSYNDVSVELGTNVSLTLTNLSFNFQPSVYRQIEFDDLGRLILVSVRLEGTARFTGTLALKTTGSGSGARKLPLPGVVFFPLPDIHLPLPPPLGTVPIKNDLKVGQELFAELKYTRGVTSSAGFEATGTLSGEVTYSPQTGATVSAPLELSFSNTPITISDPESEWELKVGHAIPVQWRILRLGGPFFSLGRYAKFKATPNTLLRQLDFTCVRGVKVDGGIELKLFTGRNLTVSATLLERDSPPPFCHLSFPFLPVPVASVTVRPTPDTVLIGDTVRLTATLRDSVGNVLTGRVVTWASSDSTVATVSESGLVTAVSPGTATLTATSEGQTGSAQIEVSAEVYQGQSTGSVTVQIWIHDNCDSLYQEVTWANESASIQVDHPLSKPGAFQGFRGVAGYGILTTQPYLCIVPTSDTTPPDTIAFPADTAPYYASDTSPISGTSDGTNVAFTTTEMESNSGQVYHVDYHGSLTVDASGTHLALATDQFIAFPTFVWHLVWSYDLTRTTLSGVAGFGPGGRSPQLERNVLKPRGRPR